MLTIPTYPDVCAPVTEPSVTALSILREGLARLTPIEHWTQGQLAATANGHGTMPWESDAVRWCAQGIMERAAAVGGGDWGEPVPEIPVTVLLVAMMTLADACAVYVKPQFREATPGHVIASVNDDRSLPPEQAHARILSCFRTAIADLEAADAAAASRA